MVIMQKKLVWQKYVDPFSGGLDSVEWPGAVGLNNDCDFHPNFLPKDKIQEAIGLAMQEDSDDDDEDDHFTEQHKKTISVLSTPMGFIPLTEHNMPHSCFDLWVGHTNFNISQAVVRILENVPGVEILNVFSKYRFLVGFGRLFKSAMVMYDIGQALGIKSDSYKFSDKLQSKINDVKQKLTKYNFWAILITPNEQIYSIYSDHKNRQFQDNYATCQATCKLVGGILLSYED
jgi:hypothetical protein